MATLDTVDAMKSSHAFVLTSERQAKQRLSDKLDRYIDFVDAAQRERDDLLDAVNVFLEKGMSFTCRCFTFILLNAIVESSNNLSLWQCCRLSCTSVVGRFPFC
jgi:hypothetical protein